MRWAFVLALILAAGWALRGQLPAIREIANSTRLRWDLVALAAAIVLLTYALLIESWRRVIGALGSSLDRAGAAYVWFVSNLARWLPGMFWQLGAMTELARRRGVPITVSTSSAVIINIVNVFTGLIVATAFMATTPALLTARGRFIIALGAVVLLAMPLVAPRLGVATAAEAAVLAIVVRLWRTVLEIAPGLIALAAGGARSEEDAQPSRGSRIP